MAQGGWNQRSSGIYEGRGFESHLSHYIFQRMALFTRRWNIKSKTRFLAGHNLGYITGKLYLDII